MRMAASLDTLARFGWKCIHESACNEHCTGGRLYDVDWETCPIGVLRKSQHIRILRGFQAVRRACGTLDPRVPAWVVRDLAELAALEAPHGDISSTQ